MGFECDTATLGRLEWPRLLYRLAAEASTSRGAEACAGDLFAPDLEAVRLRLSETSESRAILDAGEEIPLGSIGDLRPIVAAAERGQLQPASELARVLATLQAARRACSFLSECVDRAPRLAERAARLPDLARLESELSRCVAPEGELREDASRELRRARRRVRDLELEVERRMAAKLKDPSVTPHLQDHYTTFREGRPVLPVRAAARSRVQGIVHDVSSSGTTVFVEPADVVEAGNRLRLARTELDREVERILRMLTEAVHADAGGLESLGRGLEVIDSVQARGRLSARLNGTEPAVGPDEPLVLRSLRHPLLLLEGGLPEDAVVSNDLLFPESVRALVISGPNAGGKTIVAKGLGLAALAVRAGLHVPCAEQSSMPLFDGVFADIGDEQDLRAGLSTFSARMTNLARIVAEAGPDSLVVVDEVGEGTEPGEGAALAQSMLEALVDRGARVIATTHFNRLKELAGSDPRFMNASAEFDLETLLPTYRIHLGAPGSSGACWVAERMGVSASVVERARDLLDDDGQKLETLTRSLSELRQELEAERRLASQTREESESVRAEYERRVATLRSAREKALASMKADLEVAFKSARAEIAGVVRALQRGESSAGRAANVAHRKLQKIRTRTEVVERAHEEPAPTPKSEPIDWDRVEPGARLTIEGVPETAVLIEPPDRRGRIAVAVGGMRMTVPQTRVSSVEVAPAERTARVDVERAPHGDVAVECDLRGLRVDEALDRADAHLQRALGTSLNEVVFIHGHGTGALREAIRSWLTDLPYISGFRSGDPERGGNGLTIVTLED
jgi:DNA mismatch repair protein MutS2